MAIKDVTGLVNTEHREKIFSLEADGGFRTQAEEDSKGWADVL